MKEIMNFREWTEALRELHARLGEIVRTMTRRADDPALVLHEREKKALVELRDAVNLVAATIQLVIEDGRIRGDDITYLLGKYDPPSDPLGTEAPFLRFEQWCETRISRTAGLFCTQLRLHWIQSHPEFLPHRHWMVMQALGASYAKILVAAADMHAVSRA